jgi:succinyl-CoA synthetase alpha subunit
LLGEVGGEEEYKIVRALETGRITKPLVAWCIGEWKIFQNFVYNFILKFNNYFWLKIRERQEIEK